MIRPSRLESLAPWFERLRQPAARERLRPWFALLALWVLFDLPSILHPSGLSLKHFRLSADVLGLLTLGGASYAFTWGVWLRRSLWLVVTALVVYRIDEGIFGLLMHAKPLLYDQVFLVRHLLVLLSDLFSLRTMLIVVVGVLSIGLAVWASGRLMRVASALLSPERIGSTGRAAYVVWLVVLAASAVSSLTAMQKPLVRWIAPELLENLATSRKTYLSLKRNLGKSPYREFEKVELTRKPDVKLLLVESYGRLLVRAKPTSASYKSQMRAMQERLSADGWHMASAYSRASVSGGRSWLAEGSLLMGTNIMYESVYRHLTANMKSLPTLVSFFGQQGYHRVMVGPPDRERPGVRISNPYPFDQFLLFNELKYKGPAYGWGIVPDQYSMGVLEDSILHNVQKPLFLDFHFVSSHAPWDAIPPWVNDYRDLNVVEGKARTEGQGDKYALEHLRRYERRRPEYNYMGKLDGVLLARYEQSIYYVLDVIEEHLKKTDPERDQLVIIMGDHQPPVIASDKVSFDVPVHVLSRDKAAVAPFTQVGFTGGLVLGPNVPALTSHAGVFSMLVRALRVRGGKGPVPPFRGEGHVIVEL